MANGNGKTENNGNGNEAGEFLVSSIRPGMKREFTMMMKAQAESPIVMGQGQGQGRVTRSQKISGENRDFIKNSDKDLKGLRVARSQKISGENSDFIKNSDQDLKCLRVARSQKISGENSDFIKNSDQDLKCFTRRKKKKTGDENGAAEEGKRKEANDVEMAGDDGDRKRLVAAEEEETKSDILDGSSDDEKKKEQDGLEEVNVIVEKEGTEDHRKKENLISEAKDGIVEHTNEASVVLKEEKGVKVDPDSVAEEAPKSVEKPGLESGDGDTVKVVAFNYGTGAVSNNGVPQITYFRRFTRSALKSKVDVIQELKVGKLLDQSKVEEVLEQSGTEGPVDEVVRPTSSSVSSPTSINPEMSKKVLRKIPVRLKELLETGLLEGLPVRYVRGSKAGKTGETGLHGEIQGSAILCFCSDCLGNQTVTPNQFELHAGSGNKRPPEYIYLQNGKTLRDVLNACKLASSDSLELAIQTAIGRSVAKHTFCRECKGQASLNDTMLCDSCIAIRESQQKTSESSDINPRTLLPVSSMMSEGKVSCKRSKSHTQGKLTKKDLGLHKLVFQSDYVADGTPLSYYAHGKQLNTGYKCGSGIFCHCCQQVVSPSVFEAHAGCASRRKPYLQIFTNKGLSLHELSLALKRLLKHESTDQNDDVCSICEGTGELLCCDLCPRAFHIECVNLASIPEGDWSCKYCLNSSRTGNMDENANALAAGRVAGIDPVEEVRKRCIRIIGAVEPEVGGCVLCRGHDFSKADFGPRTVILCDQCEREYHVGCLKEHGMDDLKELPNEKWFCCGECSSIHSSLQQLVSDGEKRLPDHLLSIIKKKHEDIGSEDTSDLNVSWRLFHGKMAPDEDRRWLSDAVTVFRDCFDPIGDSKKNSHDLIPFMIYGRSNRDQDFGGMYSAILIVNSTVVSAGIFRIFGQEMAEIPLVATISTSQGKGYFQALFSCIENFLKSLNVRDLVLPAAHEAEFIWMSKFGFVKISAEQLKQYKRDYQMMIFQGTSVLHKTYR